MSHTYENFFQPYLSTFNIFCKFCDRAVQEDQRCWSNVTLQGDVVSQNIFQTMSTHTMITQSQNKEDNISRAQRPLENVNLLPISSNISKLGAMALPDHTQVSNPREKGKVSFHGMSSQECDNVDDEIRKYLTPTLPPSPATPATV